LSVSSPSLVPGVLPPLTVAPPKEGSELPLSLEHFSGPRVEPSRVWAWVWPFFSVWFLVECPPACLSFFLPGSGAEPFDRLFLTTFYSFFFFAFYVPFSGEGPVFGLFQHKSGPWCWYSSFFLYPKFSFTTVGAPPAWVPIGSCDAGPRVLKMILGPRDARSSCTPCLISFRALLCFADVV